MCHVLKQNILTFMLFKLHVVPTSIKICIIILNLFEMAVQFLSRIEEPFLKVTGTDSYSEHNLQ